MAKPLWLAAAVVAVGVLSAQCNAAECHSKPDPNAKGNFNPVWTGTPTFVREVKNAKLYTVGEGEDKIDVVHLWGAPYDMGVAHATLVNDTVRGLINKVYSYLEDQIEQAINGTVHNLKPQFVDLLARFGMDAALQLEVDATNKFTPAHFNDELRGLSDASGIPFKKIQHVHLIGELTKGSCSMYGAWGSATASTGKLLQLRALDWDVDGPFKDYPEIVIYHPTSEYGHAFANIAWSGFVGSITGMSSEQMAISEIGVSFPDDTFGKESRFGIPFTYILRDIMQFDNSLADAQKRLSTAKRTCDLIFGVGDGKPNGGFNSVQYSASVANFYNDQNMEPTAPWHQKIDNVVYYGMDWLCPAYNQVLHDQIAKHHGNITAAVTIQDIVPIVQTGDLHTAIYDLTDSILHVAVAASTGESGPPMAYDRTFLQLDMKAMWAEAPPSL
mmetsp:Transcript_131156/g.184994  ORF Transcript_131156/g.184994 Transcript_131156/m.184994 type:complete len:443 (-) Transcript_131156:72-1400(-)